VDLAAHVAQLPASVVVAAVDQMYMLGVLDVDGNRLRFRHPLMRAAVRALAGPAWRATAHARAAAYLREHRAPVRLPAHHTERSARPGDEAQAFAYSAPAPATGWFDKALGMPPVTGPARVAPEGLTFREAQIAELVVLGLTNQEIAARLFLSRRTVESHLSHIFTKLNVHSRTAMVHRVGHGGSSVDPVTRPAIDGGAPADGPHPGCGPSVRSTRIRRRAAG
jgi:DNA-binding CsgD family transcriptional regulator